MGRAPCCDKSQVKSGPWSRDEDLRLVAYIEQNGHHNWRALPKLAGLMRCGKSCRLRWINYLRPDLKRGNFTPEEEQTIINLHSSIGNKWAQIAASLPGRTDNEIKNVWNTHLKKRLPRTTNTKSDRPENEADDGSKMDHSACPSSCTSSSITVSGLDPNMEKAQTDQDFQESDINYDLDIDSWEMFESLDPLQEQVGEIQGSNLEKIDCDVELSKYLKFIEAELGLTTDSDNLPNQMDLELAKELELDYVQALNGSSGN